MDKGEYKLEVSTAELQNRNYFIVVTDLEGTVSKQIVNIK